MSNRPTTTFLSPLALARLPNYHANDDTAAAPFPPSASSAAAPPSKPKKDRKDDTDHVSRQLVSLGLLSPKYVAARDRIVRGPGAAEAYPKKS